MSVETTTLLDTLANRAERASAQIYHLGILAKQQDVDSEIADIQAEIDDLENQISDLEVDLRGLREGRDAALALKLAEQRKLALWEGRTA